jgi:hypothetical protein
MDLLIILLDELVIDYSVGIIILEINWQPLR